MIILKCISNKGQETVLDIGSIYFASDYYFDPFLKEIFYRIMNCKYPGGYDPNRFLVVCEDNKTKLFKLVCTK